MNTAAREIAPRQLAMAGASAVAAAAFILVMFVLPAEHGIDPTGLGSVLGLTRIAQPPSPKSSAVTADAAAPVVQGQQTKQSIARTTALRSDEKSIDLPPHSGAEVKARMRAGDHLIFRWEASAPVRVDMHGEPSGEGDEFVSYWKEKRATSAQGAFTADFEGTHGWYWRNSGDTPVTITVRTTGFYGELFEPPGE